MLRQRASHNPSGSGARGAVLTIVMVTALLSAIAIYTILFLAISQARHAGFYRQRARARYAAEAGLVWAQQRLWQNPLECFTGPSPDLTLTVPPTTINIEVTRTPCPGPPSTLTATVTY